MAKICVVHLTVYDDLEGLSTILKFLRYIPTYIGVPLPIMKLLDPPDRLVEYDQEDNGRQVGGISDKQCYTETLETQEKAMVTRHEKLGGIPVGVIFVETQIVMQVIPAIPHKLDSADTSSRLGLISRFIM